MVSAKTPTRSPLELVELNPAELVLPLDGNVRKDTRLDPEFLASIKSRGVLVPVMIFPNEDGGYDVFDGQRRTLAAVQAGHKTIPAIVAASREDADRVADQLIVNDHRTGLTDVEHMSAFQQLALFGLSASAIAKRTSEPAERVTAALKVADDPTASKALQEHNLDLLQAAVIAEFAGDKEAVKKLVDVASDNPSQFNHVVAAQRERVALDALKKSLSGQIDASEFERLKDVDSFARPSEEGYRDITDFARAETPTVPLTVDDIRGLNDVAAALVTGYMVVDDSYQKSAKIGYYLRNPEDNNFVRLQYERAQTVPVEATPEELAAREQRKAEEETRAKTAAEWRAATAVRRAWISEFLERPNLPADAIIYIAWAHTWPGNDEDISDDVIQWLDIPTDPEQEDNERAARAALDARPRLALAFVLAKALDRLENWTDSAYRDWNPEIEHELVTFHLHQLRAWGYGLSDAEKAYIADAEAALVGSAAEDVQPDEPSADDAAVDEN